MSCCGRCESGADAVPLARPHDVQRHSLGRTRRVAEQVEGEGVLDHLDTGVTPHRSHEGPGDLGAGRITSGMRDAIVQVSALASEGDRARLVAVEAGEHSRIARAVALRNEVAQIDGRMDKLNAEKAELEARLSSAGLAVDSGER